MTYSRCYNWNKPQHNVMAFYLLITLGFRFISAESLLPQPQNVEVVSNNMDAIVTWDAPLSSLRHLTYTTEYRKSSTAFFHTVCKATKEHRCDFGELPSCHGNYQFRVRTELKGNTSSWAETPNFSLKKGTVIGPPNVTLVTKGGAIGAVEVNIQNPVLKISSLKEAYSKVEYNIRYWKNTDKKDVFERERVTEQRVKLKPLEPNTRYCIQVQVYIPMPHNNTGQYSKDACVMSTPINTTTAESLLPQPQNVEVVSNNMDAIVTWDAPLSSLRHLTYTAEYRKSSTAFFHTVCKATKEHRCDFGELPSCHGNYQFRVRTELKGNTSSWAETPNFSLKKETVIGPPNVTLVTKGGAIGAVEVNIQNPVLKISSLKEAYSEVEYNIRYWKNTDKKDVFERERVTEQRVKLKPLEPNTRYCIQVQVYIPMPHNNTGQYSKDACVMSTPINTTTDGERRLSEGLVVSLVTVAVAFPLLLLVPWIIYKGRRFLHPKVKLPEHLKQHLTDSHQYTYLASQITSPLQEKYDQISALCEENPYNVLTDVPEDNLYHVHSGVSVEMPEYYNAVAENANFDMPYKNI